MRSPYRHGGRLRVVVYFDSPEISSIYDRSLEIVREISRFQQAVSDSAKLYYCRCELKLFSNAAYAFKNSTRCSVLVNVPETPGFMRLHNLMHVEAWLTSAGNVKRSLYSLVVQVLSNICAKVHLRFKSSELVSRSEGVRQRQRSY